MSANIEFISAGAGSGKTYTLTEKLEALLSTGEISPAGILATTFTKMAASELQERVRQKLIESGKTATANAMGQSLIGTVNGVCGQMVERFAFEAGLPPTQGVIDEADADHLFNQALEHTLESDDAMVSTMNGLSSRLGIADKYKKTPLWRGSIKGIVDAARSNNLSSDDLTASVSSSTTSLLAYFPKASKRDLSAELLTALKSALKGYDPEEDSTKGSKGYFDELKDYSLKLERQLLSWGDWIKLSKSAPTKKSLPLAEPIQAIASDYAKHPQLREDISDFIRIIFSIAADSLGVFQRLKNQRGLMDFVDQEQRLLEVLDNPIVIEALTDELQLLMVDEFQDTSPIQLAIFMKLSKLADKAIWVGDLKQSIYGFRGSDPELMMTVMEQLEQRGAPISILEKSWRSRPELVEYVNNLFVPAFSNTLSPEQVALTPATTNPLTGAAVEHWQLAGKNKELQASALAQATLNAVNSGEHQIVDKRSKCVRSLEFGDIAVLCRSNEKLATLATTFAEFGIPVSFQRAGLLSTREGTLAMACLRRLANARDTLASAEIRVLSQDENPEDWLSDRINHLQNEGNSSAWGEDSIETMKVLSQERDRLLYLTPYEAFEQALLVTNVRQTVASWCKTQLEVETRLKNVDVLLEYAHKYLDYCHTQNLGGTVPGLILWLQQLGESEDDQQSIPDSGAVVLLTHHRAKGLEWPLVIADGLQSSVRPRIWGLQVEPCQGHFDPENPLAGRSLRYWPTFFGGQSSGVPLKDEIETGSEGKAALLAATEEDKRLLYVSLTRARDKLVVLSTEKRPAKSTYGYWQDCVEASDLLPLSDSLELNNGDSLESIFSVKPVAEAQLTASTEDIYWPVKHEVDHTNKQPRYLSPSMATAIAAATVGDVCTIAERIELHKAPDLSLLGNALHAVIATSIITGQSSAERSLRILQEHGVAESIDLASVESMAENFIACMEEKFKPVHCHVEPPVSYINNHGQEVNGFIDLLLETPLGWVIIDHKSSPKARSQWQQTALAYSGQLDAYQQAIEAATDKPVIGCWIHFAVTGGLVEVVLPATEKSEYA